jgi:hypothetical protein
VFWSKATSASGVQQRHWIITVQVEGFGNSNDDENDNDTKKKRRPTPTSYNPLESVTVLGVGGVGKTQRNLLSKDEQSKLGKI